MLNKVQSLMLISQIDLTFFLQNVEKKICLPCFARKGLKLLAKWRILFIAESRPIYDGLLRTRGALCSKYVSAQTSELERLHFGGHLCHLCCHLCHLCTLN